MAKKINHSAELPPVRLNEDVHHVSDRTHEFEAHKGMNIARAGGKPKASIVRQHGGMTDMQRAMAGLGGMGHATTIDGVLGSNPLNPNPLPKFHNTKPTMTTPGMRSRLTDTLHSGSPGENHARASAMPHDPRIGLQILHEAEADPNTKDALAHLGVGINPLGRR